MLTPTTFPHPFYIVVVFSSFATSFPHHRSCRFSVLTRKRPPEYEKRSFALHVSIFPLRHSIFTPKPVLNNAFSSFFIQALLSEVGIRLRLFFDVFPRSCVKCFLSILLKCFGKHTQSEYFKNVRMKTRAELKITITAHCERFMRFKLCKKCI